MSQNLERTDDISQARRLFDQGDYPAAKKIYDSLNRKYAGDLFLANMKLCDLRYGKEISLEPLVCQKAKDKHVSSPTVESQLVKTQALLEYYFAKAKTLELKLKDLQK